MIVFDRDGGRVPMTVFSVFVHYSTSCRMNNVFVCVKVAFFAAHYLT